MYPSPDAFRWEPLAVSTLDGRAIGLDRSQGMAKRLDLEAPDWGVRLLTDGRTVPAIAADVVGRSGWT